VNIMAGFLLNMVNTSLSEVFKHFHSADTLGVAEKNVVLLSRPHLYRHMVKTAFISYDIIHF
jgi:hypothetical protein